MRAEARPVDVLHGHDWQAGPGILSLRTRYAHDPLLARVLTVLTCHNLAFHGWVPRERAWSLDLPASIGNDAGVDLLREAVRHADLVNTVSPTYARESLTPEYGAGLDDVAARAGRALHRHHERHRPRALGPCHGRGAGRELLRGGPERQGGLSRRPVRPAGHRSGRAGDGGHRAARSPEGVRPRDLVGARPDRCRGATGRPGHRRPHPRRGPACARGLAAGPGGDPRALRPGRGAPDLRRVGRVPDALPLRAVGPGTAHRDALRHGAPGAFHGRSRRHRRGCRRRSRRRATASGSVRPIRWPCWTPPCATIAAYHDRAPMGGDRAPRHARRPLLERSGGPLRGRL